MKLPSYVTDSRAKFYFKKLVQALGESAEDKDSLLLAQVANSLANCEKAQQMLDTEGFVLVTKTTQKAHPALEFLRSQQLSVRSGLKELRLTRATRDAEVIEDDDDELTDFINSQVS